MRFFIRALRVCQPTPPSFAVELRFGVLGAVARQQFDVLDRQEQLVAAGVMQLKAIVRMARRLDRPQADETADAVIDMDDEIAGRERRRLGDKILRAALLPCGRARGGRQECPARR